MDPALREQLRRGRGDEQIEAVLRLADEALVPAEVSLVAQFGTIATCRMRLGDVERVRDRDGVLSVKARRLLAPEHAPVEHAVVAPSPADARRPPGIGRRGRGVVIGVLDWGLDFPRRTFRRADGRSRILALWDQRAASHGATNRYGYGIVHHRAAIEAALATADPCRALGYDAADADPFGAGAHGTAVADIAAGSGEAGGPPGMAPDADLAFVHLASRGTSGLANLGDSIGILEGLDFLRRVARGRPLVVSLSVGRHGGPHDGSTLVELAIDAFLTGAPGCVLAQSAGNYGLRGCHASGALWPATTQQLPFLVEARDPSDNEVEIWHDCAECAVLLAAPDGTATGWIALGEAADLRVAGRPIARVYHRGSDPQNGSHHVDAFLYSGAPSGQWTLALRDQRRSGPPLPFHAWIERDDACATCQSRFPGSVADHATTLGTLASNHRSLVCGAYDALDRGRRAGAFSSLGPTRDGRRKPDCGAPGVGVLCLRSTPRVPAPGWQRFVRRSGTSMAAPHVAGCAALVLEAGQGRFWNEDVREIILSTLDPLAPGVASPHQLGGGYVNVRRALEAAQRLAVRRRDGGRDFVHLAGGRAPSPGTVRRQVEREVVMDAQRASVSGRQAQALLGGRTPDVLYRQVKSPTVASPEFVQVLALPGQRLETSLQAGDAIVRVALGEPGLGHLALLVDGTLATRASLVARGVPAEEGRAGQYALVEDLTGGRHTFETPMARLITDARGIVPPGQIVIRLAVDAGTTGDGTATDMATLGNEAEDVVLVGEDEPEWDAFAEGAGNAPGARPVTSLAMRQVGLAPRPSPVRARILWPALGFPAVIAPRAGAPGSPLADGDSTRCVCVLLLSNRKNLSKEEAARHLRYVPWTDRGRRQVRGGQQGVAQDGSFAEEELAVRNEDAPGPKLVVPAPKGCPANDRATPGCLGQLVAFGGDQHGANAITVNLAHAVREFYRNLPEGERLPYIHEIRVSETASARLADGLYHLFWNNELPDEKAPSDELKLLVDRFARPRRAALGELWETHQEYLLSEYEEEYGVRHPPYAARLGMRRTRTEILHPLFVDRRAFTPLRIAHLTDTHVAVRHDIYEENLVRARTVKATFNNFNRNFIAIYEQAKQDADLLLLTGDLIDYGRGHWGLNARDRLGEDTAYHVDRNWFLFYYLLASGERYRVPVYTVLGNHDWRLNPYPPFAPGAPDPASLLHDSEGMNLADPKLRPDRKRPCRADGDPRVLDNQRCILQTAHGPGFERGFSYTRQAPGLGALVSEAPAEAAKALLEFVGQAKTIDKAGFPTQTTIGSVEWYLLAINPFLDYAFTHPGGQRILMLDWAEDEDLLFPIAAGGERYPYMVWQVQHEATSPGQQARNCLSPLQWQMVQDFVSIPGAAKVIGIHAPPIGPYPDWSDEDLRRGRKTYARKSEARGPTNYGTRRPDGTVERWNGHPLFAIAPRDQGAGTEANYGSFGRERAPFIRAVAAADSGVRLVLAGHIHRNGLFVVEKADKARGIVAGEVLVRGILKDNACRQQLANLAPDPRRGPLFVNTTSAGPRGNLFPRQGEAFSVDPGFAHLQISKDGTVVRVEFRCARPLRSQGAPPITATASPPVGRAS